MKTHPCTGSIHTHTHTHAHICTYWSCKGRNRFIYTILIFRTITSLNFFWGGGGYVVFRNTKFTGNSLKCWDKNIALESKVLNECDRSQQYSLLVLPWACQNSVLANVGFNELFDYSGVTQRAKYLCCRDQRISTDFCSWNMKQEVNCRD
jgi:hypothetical protein